MAELSAAAPVASLSTDGALRERLRQAKRSVIGQACGKSDSWASKLLDGTMGITLDEMPTLIAALGLKLVDAGDATVNPAVFEAYRTIAAHALTEPSELTLKETGR